MASAADQAAGLNMTNFAQATELKRRIWFTLGALIVFRLLSHVPIPGMDPFAWQQIFDQTKGGMLDFFNMFSGGALERMSVIAVGLMPYITSSIVVQLATSMSPKLNALKKEGESGRKKLNQYTRYGAVGLAIVYGYGIATSLESGNAVVEAGWLFRVACVTALVGGTMFLMWLGEQITSRGIGNGVSLIIMAGIVAQLPVSIAQIFEGGRTGSMQPLQVLGIGAAVLAVVAFICFVERAQRRVLIQYPKRQTARGMMQSDKSHLPLKINTAGVIPPIFASSILLLPLTIAQFAGQNISNDTAVGEAFLTVTNLLGHGKPLYVLFYALGIIFFCFFYTAVMFNPEETADNLKRYGGFIPGIRPGKNTEVYLDYVLTRITVVGAAYLTLVCLVPEIMFSRLGMIAIGGTSLLIVVNVTMDTVTQIQSHLLAHQYGNLIKKAKLKGGRR